MNQEATMDKSQQSDLAAMLGVAHVEPEAKGGEEDAQTSEELETSTGQGEEEEAGGEEPQDTEPKGEEAEEGGEAEEEAPAEDATTSALTALQEQLQSLNDKIERIASGQQAPEPKEDEPEALPVLDFIGDSDIDEVTTDKQKLNAVLHKTADHGYNKAVEQMLRILPGIITKIAAVEVQNQAAAMEFYRANDDLIPHKASVSKIYVELLGKNQGKDPYETLKDLAPEARKRLKLKARGGGTNISPKAGVKKPGFAPGSAKGTRGGVPKEKNTISDDIGKMLNLR